MKIQKAILRRVINEELKLVRRTGRDLTPQRLFEALKQRGHLNEQEGQLSLEHEELGDSLDTQVDRLLSQYEQASKKDGEGVQEGRHWRDDVRQFLSEAEEDEQSEGEGDDVDNDEEPEGDVQTGKLGLNDLDVEEFANNLVRLIDNYDALLEIKNTLLRRATNFVAKNYTDEVVRKLKEALKEQHDLEAGSTDNDLESEIEAPRADRAGPGGI